MLATLALSAFVSTATLSAPSSSVPSRALVRQLTEDLAEATDPPRGAAPNAVRVLDIVEDLQFEFENASSRDRREIAKHVGKLLDRGDEEPLRDVALVAATALSTMGGEGADALTKRLDDRKYRDDHEFRRRMILSLGRTRHEDAVPELSKLLQHYEPSIVAAAAEGLGEFDRLEEADRKDVFYTLLKVLLDAKDDVDRDPRDLNAKHLYETIVGAFTTSLQRLSGHDERDPDAWLRFWNKHKKDDWDEKRP